ncbi:MULTISPECIES: monovalent cation/H(+) antiporter subunit G [Phyllobacteriaceae]|uniref:monovalent cation/H(+) antiporter subunit G n=1 Tax=Phyllobacteriaceae TaxID=69277 RepID=UPI002ACAFB98|nr:monovalent cation/H(+) antiporter subunit G [Chelativorans sp. M5D2P16]MDZ5698379.1 monovalent cation/H(+) antiporter subunit G [Chelativorans sp. M5D2P16]
MTELLMNLLISALMLIGASFTLVAAIGILRLPDLYSRMHAASKAGTLGSGVLLLALAFYAHDHATVTRALAAIVFLLLTAPLSAHLLAKAAYAVGYRLWEGSVHDDMAAIGEFKEEQRK